MDSNICSRRRSLSRTRRERADPDADEHAACIARVLSETAILTTKEYSQDSQYHNDVRAEMGGDLHIRYCSSTSLRADGRPGNLKGVAGGHKTAFRFPLFPHTSKCLGAVAMCTRVWPQRQEETTLFNPNDSETAAVSRSVDTHTVLVDLLAEHISHEVLGAYVRCCKGAAENAAHKHFWLCVASNDEISDDERAQLEEAETAEEARRIVLTVLHERALDKARQEKAAREEKRRRRIHRRVGRVVYSSVEHTVAGALITVMFGTVLIVQLAASAADGLKSAADRRLRSRAAP